jgi:hypothetical protein
MIVDYDVKFDEKRNALAEKIREEDPTYSEAEAQSTARMMLLKKMAKEADGDKNGK